ncbi:MAG: carboxypeptidase-like regulatory domain-containing protein, partial [Niabella sp.]
MLFKKAMHVLGKIRFLILIKLVLCIPLFVTAQTHTVSGTVMDDQGKPVSGASVTIKGTTTGTKTDETGKFSISAAPNSILLVSSVGYEAVEQNTRNQADVNVILKPASGSLEEVMVVGYGTQKKINMTGSVATVSSKELNNRPVTNLSSALGGLAAGVNVRQSSGDPRSDGASITIRGVATLSTTSALVLVDGVISSMDGVNPNDVESISVLKDAAS